MPVCHCVTMPMLEFTNGLSISVLKIYVFIEPIDVFQMLTRFKGNESPGSASEKEVSCIKRANKQKAI